MEIGNQASVRRWLTKLKPSTKRVNLDIFKRWMKWISENGAEFSEFDPDRLVSHQKASRKSEDDEDEYHLIDQLIQPYLSDLKGAYSYKVRVHGALRSFFKHNRASLPSDAGVVVNSDKPVTQGTLTVEEIRNMVLASSPTYQAIFLSMFQGSLDEDMFEHWNLNGWPSLREALKGDLETIRIDLPGRKKYRNIRPYHTYIGHDAVRAIRHYVKRHRPEKIPVYHPEDMKLPPERRRVTGERTPTAIFLNIYGEPISKKAVYNYWVRHLKKLDLYGDTSTGEKGYRTGKNPHEMRDLFRSQWTKAGSSVSPVVGEFCMGHAVDALQYDKACRDKPWTLGEYRKAAPYLQIISSGLPFGQIDQDEANRLKNETTEALQRQLDEIDTLQQKIKALEDERTTGIMGMPEEAQAGLQEFMELMKHPEARAKILGALRELGEKRPA